MTNTNTTSIPSMGEYRRRQQAAKVRGERFNVDPDVRAIRAAVLERREAVMKAGVEEANQKTTRPAELYRTTLDLVSDDVLHEMQRSLSNLSTRQMADIIGDVLTGRRRRRHAADIAPPPEATPLAEVTPTEEVTERPARARRTASATPAAA
ncbi:hypothetical protein ASF24_08210 [Methylobacterium sp. Leaf86]|uniref:hypothetical protein n=1 Tax=Methylobacterium sp. Leaf86 TaxID=1736242 RepID=UPI000715E080|nr:hypothetical protein [Methylobacterium sp. Leaf86]KQO49152.1 hypothetical protein ASF24_08210 [Methylobacterium sp. Leaf86]